MGCAESIILAHCVLRENCYVPENEVTGCSESSCTSNKEPRTVRTEKGANCGKTSKTEIAFSAVVRWKLQQLYGAAFPRALYWV
jgi:hypothetical protein